MNPNECQIHHVPEMSEGIDKDQGGPLVPRLKVMLQRRLTPHTKQIIKKRTNQFVSWLSAIRGKSKPSPNLAATADHTSLKAGDLVRVRSREEIQATLSIWGGYKGCGLMKDMWSYCGTVQRVLKPVERFVDERDLRVKKVKGVVLLEGALCQGAEPFGRCDRSCFFFWRQEWLEKIDSKAESLVR